MQQIARHHLFGTAVTIGAMTVTTHDPNTSVKLLHLEAVGLRSVTTVIATDMAIVRADPTLMTCGMGSPSQAS